MSDSIGVSVALGLIKTVVCVYDLITLPIYTVAQKPWTIRRSKDQTRAKPVKKSNCYSGKICHVETLKGREVNVKKV